MKTWEKILLYPIGLFSWLTDGIKNVGKKWKPAMAMLMAVVMLCGMLPATVFAATDEVTVAGTSVVDGANVTYWLCDAENGMITGEGADESNYQVKYDPATNTVTLNGATIGGNGIRRDDRYSYNIVLAEGTTNRVTSVTGSALACAYGSIVISGAGSLNATGAANGIWADRAVTITDGANVTATGLNGCGLFSDSFFETVGITNGATAILSGSTYGIGGSADVEIDNASATVTGNTAAIERSRDVGGIYKWRTSESGAFTISAETKFRANSTITRVEFVPVLTYTVIFDANGGTGTMITADMNEGEKYTLPECGFTAPSNKTFKAWSVGGEEKQPGDKITVSAAITVTAIWEGILHTCSIELVEKVWPDCDNGGKEAYYKCDGCGKFFEDANGATEIANIATWGNLPKNGHTEGTAWEKDATGHWHKCNTAGCTAKSDFAQHTPDRATATETDPVKCSVCEYEITPALGHTHAHGTEWKSDEDNHWNGCACGDKANTAAHKDENADGKCDVCAYNVGLPTIPDDGDKPSDNPQPGANTQLGLWIALVIVGSFGIVAITLFVKKKHSAR